MAEPASRVDLEIVDVQGKRGAAVPRLEITFRASPSGSTYYFHDAYGETAFTSADGTTSLDGPKLNINSALLPQINGATTFSADCDLSFYAIEKIEELRDGGKIVLSTQIWVEGSNKRNGENSETGTFDCQTEIIAAVWTDILEEVGYHDNRVMNLKLGMKSPRIRDTLVTVQAGVNRAQKKHDEGDYPGAIIECRHAVERLRLLEDDLPASLDERKKDGLDSILGPFEKGFLGGLSHAQEKTSIKPALRRDSDFAIGITKTALRYVGTVFEEES